MAMEATDRRGALERGRRRARGRTMGTVFLLGSLLGAGIAHVTTVLTTPPDPAVATDSLPPVILAVEPEEGTFLPGGRATFRIEFDEPLSASPAVLLEGTTNLTVLEESLAGSTWRGIANVSEGADGTYALLVSGAADPQGNRQANRSFPYAVDTTPPISRAFLAANVSIGAFDVTWRADDSGSGIARVDVWIRADDRAWSVLTTSPDDRGSYRFDPGAVKATFQVYATATDRVGNREGPHPTPDATVAYHGSPPSASLLPVTGYWFRTPIEVAAIATANVTIVDLRYHFATDNATWQGPFSAGNATAPFAWTFAWPLGAGHYRLHAQGRENGMQERDQPPEAAEASLGYDASVPMSRAGPIATYWHSSSLAVTAAASDERSGVAVVELHYAFRPSEDVAWMSWTLASSRSGAPWNFTFDFPRGDGRYGFAARARDAAGNIEPLPPMDEAEVTVGFDRDPPAAPALDVPRFVDAANERANLTWTISPVPDLARFEVHRGPNPDFVPDPRPCASSTTCVAELEKTARTAWVSVPATNATIWFRVRAVDDGGLAADSAAVGAVLHGAGYDTPNFLASAIALPTGLAWSERLQYVNACLDCADAFKITLAVGDVLQVGLAVPAAGDFRLMLYDRNGAFLASSARAGLGVWESIVWEALAAGTYYVAVDWGGVVGPGGRNEGWYTVCALVS